MESKSEKIYGYIGTIIFLILLILLLMILNLKAETSMLTPPEGVDIEVEESGMKSSGGGDPTESNNTSSSSNSSNVMSSEVDNTVHSPTTSNNTSTSNSNNNSSTNWNNMWNTSNNTNTSNSNSGNDGNNEGPTNTGGNKPCKGCNGSGQSLGNGDATHLIIPEISNQDEGVIVVKVKIDKDGNVVDVKEYGQQGTYGNLSTESYKKVREAALRTKFTKEPNITELRTGYLKYNLKPH